MGSIEVIDADITTLRVDAIVNAANERLRGGGGVDGAIHRAGGPAVLEDCRRVVPDGARLPTGEAIATTAGDLPARLVVHTVGPVYAAAVDAFSSASRRGRELTMSRQCVLL